MPKTEDELTDDELEVVVGGAMDKYYAIKVVRDHLNEEKKISVAPRLAPKKELNPKIWDDKDKLYKDIKVMDGSERVCFPVTIFFCFNPSPLPIH